MWGAGDTSFGGGGFLSGAGNTFDSPQGGDSKGKGRRSQNVIPVTVRQLLNCTEETIKIQGFEAQVVSIVGIVRDVGTSTTKMSMHIDDQTGTIECLYYIGTDGESSSENTLLCEGTYGRIVGALRSSKDKKYLVIFKSMPVTDLNEITCQLLETIQTGMKLKKLREGDTQKPAGTGTTGMDNTFSNSMIKGGGAVAGGAGGGIQGFTANQNLVHRIISSARDEAGMHRDQIISAVKNQMSQKDLAAVLDFLSNEGHVFSTVDDDHYKVTDAQYV